MSRPKFKDGVARGILIAAIIITASDPTKGQINRALEIRNNFIFDYKGSTEINQQAIDIVKSSDLKGMKESYKNLGKIAERYSTHCTTVQYIYPRTFRKDINTEFEPICRSKSGTEVKYRAKDEEIEQCLLTWTESKKGCQTVQKQLPEIHTRLMKEHLAKAMRKFGTKSIPAGIRFNTQTYRPYFISSGEDAYGIMKDVHGSENVFPDKCPLAQERGITWTEMSRRDRERARVVYEIIDNNLTPCLHIAEEFTKDEEKFVAFCQRKPPTQFEKNNHKWFLQFDNKCREDKNKMMMELEEIRWQFNSIIPDDKVDNIELPENFQLEADLRRNR